MSCTCQQTGGSFSCQCDRFVHPTALNIGAGLTDLPRQIAGFPEFRRAMLNALRPKDPTNPEEVNKHSLDNWKARQPDDLGIMLLEMWAYICDSLAFYDKVISQEEYLRTALQRPSLRKLVGLLGYLPRPAVGSAVYLAALAEGRGLVKIPAGTAFRSTGFNGNPPQVFELDADMLVHPFTNRWTVKPPQPSVLTSANPTELLLSPKTEPKPGIPFLLLDAINSIHSQGLWVETVEPYSGIDGKIYRKIRFQRPANLPLGYPLANLKPYMPTQQTGLWTMNLPGNPPSISTDHAYGTLALNSLHRQIKAGDSILVSRFQEVRWFQVVNVLEETRAQSMGNSVVINGSTFNTPGVSVPVTKLVLDKKLNDSSRKASSAPDWALNEPSQLVVHFAMQLSGNLTDEPRPSLADNDQILLKEQSEKPLENYDPKQFFLTDKNSRGVKVGGNLDFTTSKITLDQNEGWEPALTMPVEAFGNVIKATRGERVLKEVLGSGDATIINQTYKLKKKPLTYFSAPTLANDQGVQNTLHVLVNGVRWKEVPGFFNTGPNDEIYIVRQNDQGDSFVTFGDGVRGRRLPSGNNNILADYRYGAEQAAPPATAINQVSKPVLGLAGVNNPLPAFGGADPETAEGLRTYAPKSILTLGRIVSIQDIDAVTRSMPGVRSAQVEWRWNYERQRPLVQVWYVGDAGIEELLTARLRSLSDPSLMIQVQMATALLTRLTADLQLDDRYVGEELIKAVYETLTNRETGLLAPENVGIGLPVFRSRIFASAMAISGVVAVRNVLWNGTAFTEFAKSPGAGRYFDFEKGEVQLTINR